jgi:hypothetical protein
LKGERGDEINNAVEAVEAGLKENDKSTFLHAIDILEDILKRIAASVVSAEIQPQIHGRAASRPAARDSVKRCEL